MANNNNMFGDYEHLTLAMEKAHTGAEIEVFWGMLEKGLTWDQSIADYTNVQDQKLEALEDEMFGPDEDPYEDFGWLGYDVEVDPYEGTYVWPDDEGIVNNIMEANEAANEELFEDKADAFKVALEKYEDSVPDILKEYEDRWDLPSTDETVDAILAYPRTEQAFSEVLDEYNASLAGKGVPWELLPTDVEEDGEGDDTSQQDNEYQQELNEYYQELNESFNYILEEEPEVAASKLLEYLSENPKSGLQMAMDWINFPDWKGSLEHRVQLLAALDQFQETKASTVDGVGADKSDDDEKWTKAKIKEEVDSLVERSFARREAREAKIDTGMPSYQEQFIRLFNAIPGSQRSEAQRGRDQMYNEAKTLFYLSRKDWTPFASLKDPSLELDEAARIKEEGVFSTWLSGRDSKGDPVEDVIGYFNDPKAIRYGQGFYRDVFGLRNRMLKIKDESAAETYARFEKADTPGKKTIMDRFVFMDPDSSTRLATLVGMYNIHPGADNWLKVQMMGFYQGMMEDWKASGRDSFDFIEAFVKDTPAMASRDAEAKEEAKFQATLY